MSTDPKIDLFAKDLFNALWKHHGFATAEPPEHSPSEFNENIFRAVQTRQAMFHSAYEAIFVNTHVEFARNTSYFFDAIADYFPHYLNDEDPEEESVMCMFLSSCAFVADMCMLSRLRGDDFLDAGREVWAMFVDLHLKEAFYAGGGWTVLQHFARSDLVVYDYMRTFSDVYDCDLGKDVMFHAAHLTCAAVESFDEFEDWEGVDHDAPYALKWVDFCVQLPFVEIRSPDHYSQPIPYVFDKLEAAIWSLSYICDPMEEYDLFDDDDDDDDFDAPCSQGTKTDCTGRILGLDRELESENSSKETSSGLRSTSSSQSFDEMDQEKKDSNIGNFERVKKLPSNEEQTDSKVSKTEEEESILYNKNIPPADNPSLESKGEGALSCLLSHETLTPNDPSYFCSENDHDDTQPKMNTNPEDFDTYVDPLRRKKFSDSKSNDVSRPAIEKEYERINQRISQDSSSTEIYEATKDNKSSAEPTMENQFQSADSKSSFKTKLSYSKFLGKSGYKMPSVKPTNENPIGFEKKETKKKSKKELNSNYSNRETLQTTQNTTSETVLENPVGFSSKPQDVEKKGKKKRHRKRPTRLEQRVKEEGDAVHDVTRLIFVMGHHPGMASVASAFHDSKKQISKDDSSEE